MNIVELASLTDWIGSELKEEQIVESYTALHSVLVANTQPNQAQQPFEDQKDELVGKLAAVPLHALTVDQLTFLDRMGVAEYLGQGAVDAVEDVLFRNALDVATAAARIQEAITAIQSGIQRSDRIRTALDGCIDEERASSIDVLVRVGFTGEAAINNVVDLKEWAATWHQIGRGLAFLHGKPPEEVRVVGAGRGSLVIELAVMYGIAQTVAAVILKSLEAAEKVATIKLKAEELKGLKLQNASLAKGLEEEADAQKSMAVDSIVTGLVEEAGVNPDGSGDKANALSKAVGSLVDFLEKGGEVDCVLPDTDEEGGDHVDGDDDAPSTAQIRKLRESFSQIRLLESRIRQLEAGESEVGEPESE